MEVNFNAYLIAAVAGIAAIFWQQLKSFCHAVTNQFIHRHNVAEGSEVPAVQIKIWNYLEQHCKPVLDFSLPTLASRWMYVQKQNQFSLVVANLKIKSHPVLYRTPYGHVWVCDRGATLKWMRGFFRCKEFMMSLSQFKLAEEAENVSNRLASVERITGTRQKARMGMGPSQRSGGHGGQWTGGDSGMEEANNDYDKGSTRGSLATSVDIFTTPQLSRLLTHEYDDFKLDNAAIDLIIVDDQLDKVIKSVDAWIMGKTWYRSHHIPWRYGLLLHGLPGTGKTNSVRYISTKYNMPVYSFDLSSMTNEDFTKHWNRIAGNASSSTFGSIILFEDFDAVFEGRKNIVDAEGGVTFDTILNALDGVQANDGVLLIITTNRFSTVDSALSMRPGRIEKTIKFDLPDKAWRSKCIAKILSDWPVLVDNLTEITDCATHTTVMQTAIPVGIYMALQDDKIITEKVIADTTEIAIEMNKNNKDALARWQE